MEIAILENLGCSPEILSENIEKLEKAGHKIVTYEKTEDHELLKERLRDCDAILLANMPLSDEVLASARKVKFIDVAFTGVDHIPMAQAKEREITVSNASGYANDSVAELVISLMVQLLRDLPKAVQNARTGKTKSGLHANLLKGKTVGLIGAGAIGQTLARLCKVFGATVLVHNRHKLESPYVDGNVSLDELLENADIVSLHCPLTEETSKLIGKKELERMKKSAFLINTARGGVVDNSALADALNDGEIAGAAEDVFDMEPPLPDDYPLLHAKNIILTPHLGFFTDEAMDIRAKIAFSNLFAWLDGKPENVIEYTGR